MARQKQAGVITKICMRCNRVLPLIEYYPNKGWKQQMYRDSWCRDCAKEYCTDKEKLEQYCYENNRLWKDKYWETARKHTCSFPPTRHIAVHLLQLKRSARW